MKASQKCYDFIKAKEGYHKRLSDGGCTAYPDVGSDDGEPWTIGYGTTTYNSAGFAKYKRTPVKEGDILTADEALSELNWDIASFAAQVDGWNLNLSQGQFDAVVSFVFNAGPNNKNIERLRAGDFAGFAAKLPEYIKGENRKPLAGLISRRAEEHAWFTAGGMSGGALVAGDKGGAVKALHDSLAQAGFLGQGDHGEHFTIHTQGAVKWFQRSVGLVDDGIVGPKTRAALALAIENQKKDASKPTTHFYLGIADKDRAQVKSYWRGLVPLVLEIGNQGDYLIVASGQAYAQNFRKPNHPASKPGCMEPLPQGTYRVGGLDWAAGPDNYNASHGRGLGPLWVALPAAFPDDRSAFGIHLDAGAPGSAGCVVIHSTSELRRFVTLFRRYRPKTLTVDWGLS